MSDEKNSLDVPNFLQPFTKNHEDVIAHAMARALDGYKNYQDDYARQHWKNHTTTITTQGHANVKTLDSTYSFLISKPDGVLDGTTISFGGLSFTYPTGANKLYDYIPLPAPGIPIQIKGTSGDVYNVIESTIMNWSNS